MKDIIKTVQIEYGNSTFLIDLARHSGGRSYIEILQILRTKEEQDIRQTIRINPVILQDIIEALQKYLMEVPKDQLRKKQKLSEAAMEKIQHHYLIGVPMEDLAMQFDCPKNLIENVLRNRGIAIVSNKIPKFKRFYRKKRK